MRNKLALAAILATIIWSIGGVAAFAQAGPTTGMGSTSPLGTLSEPSTSSGGSGIPLGATELNTPGISPLAMPCPNTTSNGAFDGGGSTVGTACGSATASSIKLLIRLQF
jgi:hypothetical protein